MKTFTILALLILSSLGLRGQTFHCKHRFTNSGFDDEETITIKLRYGHHGACDTLFIGKSIHYVLVCGSWSGWAKWDKKPKDASKSDGYCLTQEVNPKNGRRIMPNKSEWFWFIYLDDMCGHKLYRVTYMNLKTNQYIAYIK